ncbi:TPA: LPD38 domain-containing protein [Aeromonas veronii]
MDKPGLRDALPQPKLSDTRTDPFWSNLDSSLSAAAAPSAAQTPQRDLNVGLGDVARGVGAGALDLVGGIGELARQASQFGKENAGKQGGDYLEQARANMASKLSPVLDVVAGAGDLAKSGAESLTEGMSGDAKEAIGRSLIDETPEGRLTMGDGAGDLDVWAMKMAQGVGSMVPTLLAGGVTGAAAKASIGRAVTTSMIKRGATQEVAEAVAAKTVAKLATGAAVTTGATGSVGSAGVNTRESVLGMSFDELSRSDTFRQAFTRIDQDQQTQHLSDEEKLSLAREETANVASRATMSDAKVWGAAAMGSVMGDAMLFKMLAGKAATGGVLKGAAKGAVGEGIGETLEEGVQQYTINESLNEVAAADIDPMKGVVSSALEGGLIGMGTGGALGGAGGLRGSKSQPESEGGAQADPATVEDVAPVEQGDPMQANPAAAPADPDLAPAADAMADPVVAPSGEQSPLGPSASQFDELRDVPAYLRRDDTAERFKGMAADSEVQRALAGEFGQSVQELVASQMQAGDQGKSLYERAQAGELGLDPFAGNKSAQQVAMENQRPALPLKDVIFAGDANAARGMTKEGHFDDKPAGTGPQFRGAERTRWQSGQEGDVLPPETSTTKPAGELPGAVIEGEAREVGTELPHRDVVYGADQRQPDAKPMRGSATESAVGPLQTLRITRKGKPFATEKEAAMASRKGKEMPVPLNGGGFGVAEIAEVEQVKAAATTQPSAPQLDDISVTDPNQPSDQPAASVSAETVPAPSATSGDASQLAPAIDTGYREVIPVNQPQTEVSNEPVTPVPAISSEGQGDQPGAGEPAAAGAGPAIAGLADRAGSGNPADNTPAPPVPDGQQQDDPTLTAPAPDAGAAVSEVAQPDPVVPAPVAAPTPWAEAIDNPDGTITLKGDVPLIKQWAKDSGVKAIPGKGGMVVAKSSAAKVREYVAPAASEPVQQIEADAVPASNVRLSQQRKGLSVEDAGKVVDDFLRDYNGNIPVEPFIREKASEIYGPSVEGTEFARTTKGAYHPSAGLVTIISGNAGDNGSSLLSSSASIRDIPVRKPESTGAGVSTGAVGEQKGEQGGSRGGKSSREHATGRVGKGEGGAREAQTGRVGAKEDLIKTLRHELLGHYGTDTFTPENKRSLLQKLIDAKQQPWLAKEWSAANKGYKHLDDMGKAEEVFASIAEKELPPRTIQTWNDIKTEFARLLRKAGLVKGPIKEHELDSLIRAVGKGIRNGDRTKQNIRGDQEVIGKQADEPAKDDKPERIISFSKQAMSQGEKPAKHLTRKEAELVTKEWFKQYRGASGIDVQIHATQAELEKALGLAAKDGLIRRAAFDDDNGTLHVAADTIASPKRMREILRHEVLAHYGLANVLGDGEYTKLISRIIKSKSAPSMKAVWDWVDTHYAGEDVGVQAEEVIAHLAELEQSAWRRGWDQVVAWVTKALRTVGFVPGGITAAETRVLIEGLGKKMKRGGPDNGGPDGGHKFSQESEQPAKKGGLKMSQANTAADKAMEKLNLGPKPDIIDKTKANLDKLRKVDRGVVESWVDRFIKKANTEVLDALAPIKYAEDAAGITDAADSGYVAARMATGAASTMQATMLYGLPEWKDGVIQRKAGTGEKDALLGIFSDLGADLHNWLGWMAGHRAELLMAQGRENLLDANDIAALKGQGKGKEAKFLDAKARWNRLNAATLDLAQEAGLFTKEARAEFENEWYIPFFRETEDGDVIAPFKPKGIANQNAGIKKLKGGEANTNDLLENIFTSTSKLIDASMKNMAAQKTVWNLADTGLIEVIPKPNKMDYQALANGKDRIMLKLEGEEYMLRVEDPDLYRAMTFFDRQPFGALVNVASKAKRILTIGITSSPEFMLRNFLRDSLSSWTISKDGFKPMIDSIKGVRKTWRMEGSTIDVMFSGASFLGGYVNGNDPGAMADAVRKSLRRKGMTPEQIAKHEKSIVRNAEHAKEIFASVWDKYSQIGEAIENGNREAVYDAAIKAGKSHAQAAFESKDLMDFSMLGSSRVLQTMTQVLPFFNARIQGLGKLTRELRDNPREIAKRAGMITAASLALLAYNWDDERYEALQDWEKDSYWHVWLDGQHWRIPKPFEIGTLFGTIPERIVRAMGDKDTGAKFGKAMVRAFGDTFAFNPIPQIIKPAVEASVNYDFFKGAPIDSPQDLAVQAEARYSEQTSLLMRELGELSGFSPKQLEHLLMGYTGTLGAYVMAAADGLIRASRPGESASWRADEIPLVKAVYRGSGPAKSTQHMEEFYRMLNEVNQLKRTVDQYRSEGLTDKANELLEEQGGILKSRRSLSRTQQQVRVVRNRIELIQRDRTLTAEEKRRRIDEMLARRNDLVYQAVNKNKANWE